MIFENLIKMNDWNAKKFIEFVLIIQSALVGLIYLDKSGITFPILRQFIGFIYLSFLPGIIILRILKLHKLSTIETVLYSIGLSLSTLMFTGFFLNTIFSYCGISDPISLKYLLITMTLLVSTLCFLVYKFDIDFYGANIVDKDYSLSHSVLFLCLIPFVSIFGTYLVNSHHNNVLLMFFIILLAITFLLVAFDLFIPHNLYPFSVFIFSLSLLYHVSLISVYLAGYDIHYEYLVSSKIIENSQWNQAIPTNINSMLSVVMLSPIYSNILNLDIIWIFKIIYPFFYSLVPLGLYRIFKTQTNEKIAFASCLFFISIFTFYNEMLQLARQEIAELFFVLSILLIFSENINKVKRSFLLIIFSASLIVSHYALSYFFLFFLIFEWLLFILINNYFPARYLKAKFSIELGEFKENTPTIGNIRNSKIGSSFIIFVSVFLLSWYIYISQSSNLQTLFLIWRPIINNFYSDMLDPDSAQGLGIMVRNEVSLLYLITKYLHFISQSFICLGFIGLILKYTLKPEILQETHFNKEYFLFSIISFLILFASLIVPYFASALEVTRVYHITLFFLAPFFVIGDIFFFKIMVKLIKKPWTIQSERVMFKLIYIFLIIFLLFNTGFVFEVFKDRPSSISLNETKDYPRFNDFEVYGARWLVKEVPTRSSVSSVYADTYARFLLAEYDKIKPVVFWGKTKEVPEGRFVFLRSLNVNQRQIVTSDTDSQEYIPFENSTFFSTVLVYRNKIYENGGSDIYK